MNGPMLKKHVAAALAALAKRYADRPVVVWTLHLIEGLILSALVDGVLDETIALAQMELRDELEG